MNDGLTAHVNNCDCLFCDPRRPFELFMDKDCFYMIIRSLADGVYSRVINDAKTIKWFRDRYGLKPFEKMIVMGVITDSGRLELCNVETLGGAEKFYKCMPK